MKLSGLGDAHGRHIDLEGESPIQRAVLLQHPVRRLVESQRVPQIRRRAVSLFGGLKKRFAPEIAHRFVERQIDRIV